MDVVDADDVDFFRRVVFAEGMDDGDSRLAERRGEGDGQGRRGDDDAVDAVLPEQIHRLLRLGFLCQVDDQRPEPAILQLAGEQVEDVQENRVLKIVGYEADQLRAFCRQAPGDQGGTVAELPGCLQHLSPGLLGNAGAFGERAGDGRARDAGAFRHFLQGNRHELPSVACVVSRYPSRTRSARYQKDDRQI